MPLAARSSSPSGAGRHWHAPAVLGTAIVLFFARAWSDSVQFLYLDTGRAHEPMKRFIASELGAGRFPAWNPYSGLGVPLVAGAIDAVQHPFTLLLGVLPFDLAFKLWIVSSYALAALGAFAWARQLGASRAAAVGGGLAFALSGFLVSQSHNVTFLTAFAALPSLLAAAHAWGRSGRPRDLALLGGASAICAAAGDPQSWAIGAAAAGVVSATIPGAWAARASRGSVGALAIGVGAAPFVLPVVLWLPHTSRAQPLLPLDLARWNVSLSRLPELILPDLFRDDPLRIANPVFQAIAGNAHTAYPWSLSIYVGVAVAVLAGAAAARSVAARVLLVCAVVGVWMSLGPQGGGTSLARFIPVLDAFRYWEKSMVWVALLASMAAAIGITQVARDPRSARSVAVASAVLAAALAVLWLSIALARSRLEALLEQAGHAAVAPAFLDRAAAAAARSLVAAVVLTVGAWIAARSSRAVAALILATLVCADVASASWDKYVLLRPGPALASAPPLSRLPPAGASRSSTAAPELHRIVVAFPPNLERWPELSPMENLLRWGARTLDTPWNVPNRVGGLTPYAGMVPDRLFAHQIATGFAPPPSVGIWGFSAFIVRDSPATAGQVGIPPPYSVLAADPELPAFAVEIPHRPRAYLATSVLQAGPDDALRFVLDPRATRSPLVVLESAVSLDGVPPSGNVTIEVDEPCRVRLGVVSDRPALLVLNDAFAPGWTARADAIEVPILRANYLARAVRVGAGRHTVEFTYRTPGLALGWAAFAAGCVALGIWALVERRRRSASGPVGGEGAC